MNVVESKLLDQLRDYLSTINEADEPISEPEELIRQALIEIRVFTPNARNIPRFTEYDVRAYAVQHTAGKTYAAAGKLLGNLPDPDDITMVQIVATDRATSVGRHPKGGHSDSIDFFYRPADSDDTLHYYVEIDDEGTINVFRYSLEGSLVDKEEYKNEQEFKSESSAYPTWKSEYYSSAYEVKGLPEQQPRQWLPGKLRPRGTGPKDIMGKRRAGKVFESMNPFQYFMAWFYSTLMRKVKLNRMHGFGPAFDMIPPTAEEELGERAEYLRDNDGKLLDLEDTIQHVKQRLDIGRRSPSDIVRHSLFKQHFFGKPVRTPLMAAHLQNILDRDGKSVGVVVVSVDADLWMLQDTLRHDILRAWENWEEEYNRRVEELAKRGEEISYDAMRDLPLPMHTIPGLPSTRHMIYMSHIKGRPGFKRLYSREVLAAAEDWSKFFSDIYGKTEKKKLIQHFMKDIYKERRVTSAAKLLLPGDIIVSVTDPSDIICPQCEGTDSYLTDSSIICQCGLDRPYDSLNWIEVRNRSDILKALSGHKVGKKTRDYLIKVARRENIEDLSFKHLVHKMSLESGIGYDIKRDLLFGIPSLGDDNNAVKERFRELLQRAKLPVNEEGEPYFHIEEVKTAEGEEDDPGLWHVYFNILEKGALTKEQKQEWQKIRDRIGPERKRLIDKWDDIIDYLYRQHISIDRLISAADRLDIDQKQKLINQSDHYKKQRLEDGLAFYLSTLRTDILGDPNPKLIQHKETEWHVDRWINRFPTKSGLETELYPTDEDSITMDMVVRAAEIVAQSTRHRIGLSGVILDVVLNGGKRPLPPLYGQRAGHRLSDTEKSEILRTHWEDAIRELAAYNISTIPGEYERIGNELKTAHYANEIISRMMNLPDFEFDNATVSVQEKAVRIARAISSTDIMNAITIDRKTSEFDDAVRGLVLSSVFYYRKRGIALDPSDSDSYKFMARLFEDYVGYLLSKDPQNYIDKRHIGTFSYELDMAGIWVRSMQDYSKLDIRYTGRLSDLGRKKVHELLRQRPKRLLEGIQQYYEEYGMAFEDVLSSDKAIEEIHDADTKREALEWTLFMELNRASDLLLNKQRRLIQRGVLRTKFEDYISKSLKIYGFRFDEATNEEMQQAISEIRSLSNIELLRVILGEAAEEEIDESEYEGIDISGLTDELNERGLTIEQFINMLRSLGENPYIMIERALVRLTPAKFVDFVIDAIEETVGKEKDWDAMVTSWEVAPEDEEETIDPYYEPAEETKEPEEFKEPEGLALGDWRPSPEELGEPEED